MRIPSRRSFLAASASSYLVAMAGVRGASLALASPPLNAASDQRLSGMTTTLTDKKHYILCRNGKYDEPTNPLSTNDADMSAMFAAYSKRREDARAAGAPMPALVVHFHGGLVGKESALEDAGRNLIDGLTAGGAGYPVFFVWQTGAMTSIEDWVRANLESVFGNKKVQDATRGVEADARDPDNQKQVDAGARWQSLDASGYTFAPRPSHPLAAKLAAKYRRRSSAQALQRVIDKAPHFAVQPAITTRPKAPYSAVSPHVTTRPMVDKEVGQYLRGSTALAFSPSLKPDVYSILGGSVVRTIWRWLNHRDHATWLSTLTEEVARGFGIADLGAGVWGTMKSYCDNAFESDGKSVGAAFLANSLHLRLVILYRSGLCSQVTARDAYLSRASSLQRQRPCPKMSPSTLSLWPRRFAPMSSRVSLTDPAASESRDSDRLHSTTTRKRPAHCLRRSQGSISCFHPRCSMLFRASWSRTKSTCLSLAWTGSLVRIRRSRRSMVMRRSSSTPQSTGLPSGHRLAPTRRPVLRHRQTTTADFQT
jgi:hypothetical protein